MEVEKQGIIQFSDNPKSYKYVGIRDHFRPHSASYRHFLWIDDYKYNTLQNTTERTVLATTHLTTWKD